MIFFRIWHIFWIGLHLTSLYNFDALNCLWDYINVWITIVLFPILLFLSFGKYKSILIKYRYYIIVIEFFLILLLSFLSFNATFGFNVG
jgi:hypothetical protein